MMSIFIYIWFEDQMPGISAVHDDLIVPRGDKYWAKKEKKRE